MVTANFYCVKCQKKTGTTGITAHIASNNRKYIKGICTTCKKNKTCFVSDSDISGAGLKDVFKKIGKVVGKSAVKMGKNVINNPQRAFELGQQSAMAAITRNPALLGKTALDVGKFYKTGKGSAKSGKGLYLKRQLVS